MTELRPAARDPGGSSVGYANVVLDFSLLNLIGPKLGPGGPAQTSTHNIREQVNFAMCIHTSICGNRQVLGVIGCFISTVNMAKDVSKTD